MSKLQGKEFKRSFLSRLKRAIFYFFYYFFARWLPLSYAPGGRVWRKIRLLICRNLFKTCGRNVIVETRARFLSGRTVSISDNSMIGENALIIGTVTIGANVLMAPDVVMISMNHEFLRTDIPMLQQGHQQEQPISIGDDVWIGARAIILPGVSVGSGVVIGAGAVVAKDIPDRAVVVGNPARITRYRTG